MKTNSDPVPPAEEILIAEDSPTQAQRLRHILEKQGYRVNVATNGRLALEDHLELRRLLAELRNIDRGDPARAAHFYQQVRRYWPGLKDDALSPDYSGVRPKATRLMIGDHCLIDLE